MADEERAFGHGANPAQEWDSHGYEDGEDQDEWHRPDSRRRRGRRLGGGPSLMRILLVTFAVILVLIAGVAGIGLWVYGAARERLFQGDPSAKGSKVFTVRSGDTLNQVLARLESEGILRRGRILDDRTIITLYREFNDEPIRLKAGTVRIENSASLVSILQRIQTGGDREFSLTIPEGKSVAEVAELVKRKRPDFDAERFVALSKDPDFVRSQGVDEATLEGYLFPSTYDFPPGTTPEELIEAMVRAFRRTMAEIQRTTPNTTGRPLREIVIIASLIEKEARSDEDRALIAGVIENRLGRNMRLQIDATVNYALGSWRRLTYADYKFESAYNTYLNDGLPPGPICSPGAASLRAALNPEESDYLFYVYKGDGHHAFAVTYEEHLKNVRAYIRNDPEALRVLEEQAAEAARSVPPTPTMVVDPSATPVVPENDGVSPEPGERRPSQPAPLAPRQY